MQLHLMDICVQRYSKQRDHYLLTILLLFLLLIVVVAAEKIGITPSELFCNF